MEKTTIQINLDTLERLKMLKKYSRESYDEILNGLLDETEEETLTEEEIKEIQKGLNDIKERRTASIEEVAKELGVNLS
jgi:predicted CopG family antitoxin